MTLFKYFSILAVSFTGVFFSSCAMRVEDDMSKSGSDLVSLTVDIGSLTKMNYVFDSDLGLKLSWEDGDKIAVTSGTVTHAFTVSSISEDGKSAVFTGVDPRLSGSLPYSITYPFSAYWKSADDFLVSQIQNGNFSADHLSKFDKMVSSSFSELGDSFSLSHQFVVFRVTVPVSASKLSLSGAWGASSYTVSVNGMTGVETSTTAYLVAPVCSMEAGSSFELIVDDSHKYKSTELSVARNYVAGTLYSMDFTPEMEVLMLPEQISTVLWDGSSYAGGTNVGDVTYRIPGLARTNAGTLIAVCDRRNTGWLDVGQSVTNGYSSIDIVCRRSTDGGKTWTETEVVRQHSGTNKNITSYSDPCIGVNRQTDEIVVAYCASVKGNTKLQIWTSVSRDQGATWTHTDISNSVYVTNMTRGFAASGAMAQMADGRLGFVIPATINGSIKEIVVIGERQADGSYNWVPQTPYRDGGDESKYVELPDGSRLMSIRTFGTRQFERLASGSTSWSATGLQTLEDAGCNGDLLLFDRGEGNSPWLIQSLANKYYESDKYRRTNVSMYVSKDFGASWTKWKEPLSDDCINASRKTNSGWTLTHLSAYSSMTQIDANTVGILVEEDWNSRPESNTDHSGEYSIVFSTHDLRSFTD